MRRSERRILVLAVVVVVVIVVQMAFTIATGRRRRAKISQINIPESIVAYQELASDPGTESELQAARQPTIFPQNASEIMAEYARAFEHMQALLLEKMAGRGWSQSGIAYAHPDLIAELRRVAALGGPIYPLDFSNGLDMKMPHLRNVRIAAGLLCAAATIQLAEGNYDEAVHDLIACMQLGDALAQEPVLESQRSRIECHGRAYYVVRQYIDGGDMPPELLAELIGYTSHADNGHAFAESLRGELMMGLQLFSDLQSGDERLYDGKRRSGRIDHLEQSALSWFYGSPFGQPLMNIDERAYADMMSRAADAAELPYYEARDRIAELEQEFWNPLIGRVSRDYLQKAKRKPAMPQLDAAFRAQAAHEAQLGLMQIGLLVEQYRAQRGSYPDSLDAIAPSLGGSLPLDPFTGEQYLYYPSGDICLLYSVGRNLVDDGGTLTHHSGTGDLVWREREE